MRRHPRPTLVVALLVTALASLVAPHHRVLAGPVATPTCTDLRPGGQTYDATKFLTSPGILVGTPRRDILVGSSGDDVIKGLGGDDLICGNGGNDIIDAGTGNDVVTTAPHPDKGFTHALGGPGNDALYIRGDAHGDAGNDYVNTTVGTAWGDAGNDTLETNGGLGAYGGAGNDTLYVVGTLIGDGGSGDDYLRGQYDVTTLFGGSGNDIVSSHPISPVASMDGGSGTDTCDPPAVPSRSCEILK